MSSDFDLARIESLKTRILAYETAIDAVLVGGVAEYSLNTGQTVTRVTKLNVKDIQIALKEALNSLYTLEIRCGVTSNSTVGRPLF